ncbi:flagellar protein FlgN [Erythrobacter aureus]|uniref:Flagellar protein FlgN n=1 Tax=Erythrobacter aureus TaxID=2182384 RepID=A0A345YID4_9SPHN|nr:flagellar protein FlgN [Erythrobacter aureus]AXK43686.1 flagellar protein FlgN [Erythrobacter aureus]
MISKLLDISNSLAELMRGETADLEGTGHHVDHEEISNAKLRLVANLEAEIARLNREHPEWLNALTDEDRATLSQVMQGLRDTAAENQVILKRHLDLSTELIDAVSDEARRVTGKGGVSYQSSGALAAQDKSSPISVNTQL